MDNFIFMKEHESKKNLDRETSGKIERHSLVRITFDELIQIDGQQLENNA